uniref:Natural killer cells antigen CD94 n=1 Tax=Cavia porcellus TaxID=10141 RepID=H0VEZ2_CAVPO|nr:natural killer cells antigen CD94-like [Cavia porcellus]XP_023421057.1 natural killer cells antigen CD94-like [Cavia porcellus]XP_023421058.1 natural killer cells antigen CD94-like [Cavia porcellus]
MAASQITLWRIISGTFGVICLILMVTLGILLKNTFTKQSIQPTLAPEPIKELQEVPDCCSCQEKWIGYQCNCYFISDEKNTWTESSHFCASHNSSLLQLQNSDELAFMKSTQMFYWTGLSFTKEHGAWLWEDGSAPSQDLLSLLPIPTPGHCVVYSPRRVADSKLCEISTVTL